MADEKDRNRVPAAEPEDPGPAAPGDEAERKPQETEMAGEGEDVYPLREAKEDPTWAVRTVWIWIGFALGCLAFIVILLILGIFYD